MSDAAPIAQYVSDQVRSIRAERRLSAGQLAERVTAAGEGVAWDRFTVGNLERGRRKGVNVDELYALAKALDVSVGRLLPDSGDQVTLDDILRDTIAALEALRQGLT